MTKKILIVTDNLPDQINGVVTTYKNIEAMALLDGYTVDYIHPGRYRYIDCPKYNEVKLTFTKKVGKTIKEINPDYIHIATEGPICLLENILQNAVLGTILLTILNFLKV
jgi:hypothetical protein